MLKQAAYVERYFDISQLVSQHANTLTAPTQAETYTISSL